MNTAAGFVGLCFLGKGGLAKLFLRMILFLRFSYCKLYSFLRRYLHISHRARLTFIARVTILGQATQDIWWVFREDLKFVWNSILKIGRAS